MKNLLILFFLLIISSACHKETVYPETLELEITTTDVEEVQKEMIQKLATWYLESDKSLDFYEMKWGSRFLLNYNPEAQVIAVSTDLCSGYSAYYIQVDDAKMALLKDESHDFESLNSILLKEQDYTKWQKVKTNIDCLK